MKCAQCNLACSQGAVTVTLYGERMILTATWCEWCTRRAIGRDKFIKLRQILIQSGWIQDKLPFG